MERAAIAQSAQRGGKGNGNCKQQEGEAACRTAILRKFSSAAWSKSTPKSGSMSTWGVWQVSANSPGLTAGVGGWLRMSAEVRHIDLAGHLFELSAAPSALAP
jgi:hypothetical protein